MDEFRRCQVPPFGSWDCTDDLPFTQCFESARQAGLFRCSYSEDRDLYVTGDLYQNDLVTRAMIIVPGRRAKARYPRVKDQGRKEAWVKCNCDCDVKAPPSPVPPSPPPARPKRAPKAVDEDLYKISPELLRRAKPPRKVWAFFSNCLQATCAP